VKGGNLLEDTDIWWRIVRARCVQDTGSVFLVHGANRDDLCEAFGRTTLSRRSLSMYVSAICKGGSYPVLSISPMYSTSFMRRW
jgi:hypothetical protein